MLLNKLHTHWMHTARDWVSGVLACNILPEHVMDRLHQIDWYTQAFSCSLELHVHTFLLQIGHSITCTLATLFVHFPLLHLQKQSSKKSREDNISTCHCVLLIIKIHDEVVKNKYWGLYNNMMCACVRSVAWWALFRAVYRL